MIVPRSASSRRRYLGLVATVLLLSCQRVRSEVANDERAQTTAGELGTAILPWRDVGAQWHGALERKCWNVEGGIGLPSWEVPDSLIRISVHHARQQLGDSLRTSSARPDDYAFQVVGLTRQSRRVILLNGIHVPLMLQLFYQPASGRAPLLSIWTVEPVLPCDGGMIRVVAIADTAGNLIRPIRFNPLM